MSVVATETPATSVARSTDAAHPLIALDHVCVRFVQRPGMAERLAALFGAPAAELVVQAVSDVSLTVAQGEVVGLVGESGCGKSTLGRVVAGLLAPSEGSVRFRGEDIATMSERRRREAALAVQMIFQDPFASLNPRMTVAEIIGEAPRVHGLVSAAEQARYVDEIMQRVGLDPSLKRRYPHQFSGGQRQRIGIARALAVKPQFLVCDEAVASLDVSIQAQIINLFLQLRQDLGLTYLFISHDLGVIEHLSDRVMVMYLGRVVEEARTEDLFAAPNHPYTQALLQEVPRLDSGHRQFEGIRGEIPSPLAPPPGCHFHPRCPHAMAVCREVAPPLAEIAPGRRSACHLNTTR
ncbi:MAG: ABC transporter ATP-binding protein [Alphaproteobacteria bacterium]|nr:ABC transporter ATP-binding protein [Alphaproteobacteria bacterium]